MNRDNEAASGELAAALGRGDKPASCHDNITNCPIWQDLQKSQIFPFAIQVFKRDRWCIVGKGVRARPLGLKVFATAYRTQNATTTVSIRPDVLAHCRQAGCRFWIVRHDLTGKCFLRPLSAVESSGWLRTSGGEPEWFVSLDKFLAIPWQTWPYVESVVRLSEAAETPEPVAQLDLWGGMAA